MNFYTSNSEHHHRYVFWVLLLVFVPAFGLFIFGIFLEPIYGDLTRIGSYSEREFGWSQPQSKFHKPLYTTQYYRYHDVVVLGDSFSRGWPQHQWQNYLVSATDWSVVTLDINTTKFESVLQSPVFRETPPKLFVYESVERYLPKRIIAGPPCIGNELKNNSIPIAQTKFARLNYFDKSLTFVERDKPLADIKLGFVINYLWNGALRNILNEERTDARIVKLTHPAPFSSKNTQEMLVFKDDIQKVSSWQQMGRQDMDCRIERMRQQVEANGKTRFIVIVAPDKLTAYSEFIRDENLRNISKLSQFSEPNKKVIPRIDLALTSAIRNGEKDVYLPDDTHWGASGHRIVAETLIDFLLIPE